MRPNLYLKLLALSVLVSTAYFLFDVAFSSVMSAEYYIWLSLSNFLIIVILAQYITFSTQVGSKLLSIVFSIFFVIGFANILIEAYIFNVTTAIETIIELANGFFVAILCSAGLIHVFNKWSGSSTELNHSNRSILSWFWRLIIGDFLYVFFYSLAGFSLQAIYPEFLEFYQGKIPPLALIFQTQFVRGFVFIAIAIVMVQSMNSSLLKKALVVGLTFSILGGIAPLIPPNEYMPAYVRVGHAFEVGISNFLFGFVLAFLFNRQSE